VDEPHIRHLLSRGELLTAPQLDDLLAQPPDTLIPWLVDHLPGASNHDSWVIALTLGALADPRGAAPLAALLSDPKRLVRGIRADASALYIASWALSRCGPAALPHLRTLLAQGSHDVRTAAAHTLVHLAWRTPTLRSDVVDVLRHRITDPAIPLVERQFLTLPLELMAWPKTLELTWSTRLPALTHAVDVPWSHFPDTIEPPNTTQLYRNLDDDPHIACADPSTAALHQYTLDLTAVTRSPADEVLASDAFLADIEKLCRETAPSHASTAGRNDPCPCGSGKKYKKCCERSTTPPNPLHALLYTVEWPALGYRWWPSQQVRELGTDAVKAHLDVLHLTPMELRHRLPKLTDDYLLWAATLRLYRLGHRQEAAEVATLVAASDQHHPALNYRLIEHASRHMAFSDVPPMARTDANFHINLQGGTLTDAWHHGAAVARKDPNKALALFLDIQRTYPHNLWTTAALAEALLEHGPALAIPHVRRALAEAEAGPGGSHPMLPDRPCPPDVLRAYLAALEKNAQDDKILLRHIDLFQHNALSQEQVLSLVFFQICHRHLPAAAWDQVAPAVARHMHQCLQSPGGGPNRQAIFSARQGTSILWILPTPSDTPSQLLTAALGTFQETAPATHPRTGPWGSWTAVLLPTDDPDPDIPELAAAILAENAPDAMLTPLAWDMLRLLATDIQYDTLLQLQQPAPAPAPPLPDAPPEPADTSLLHYLQRVLLRLIRMRKIGAAHTALGHFLSGVPTYRQGDMKEVLDVLIHEGYIRYKPTLKEPHISIEPPRLPAIWRLIQHGEIPPGRLETVLNA
jgi:HEAT repeat protein